MKALSLACLMVLTALGPGSALAGWPSAPKSLPKVSKPAEVAPAVAPAPAPAAAPAASVEDTPAAAPAKRECKGVEDVRTDVDFGELFREDIPVAMAGRQKLLLESGRELFVTAVQDVTENDLSSSYHSKNPALLFKKGEPLLILSCFRDISRRVLTLDLHDVKNVPVGLLDEAPTAFALPDQPVLWDFDAHKSYVFAADADLAAVPGAAESFKLEEKCADKGLDACVAASRKIKAEPWTRDRDERADQACERAKVRAVNECMGGTAGKEYEQNARKLDDLRRGRAVKDFEALKAKFTR